MADAILASSGIYQIRNTANGKVYIGSAVNLRTRLQYHRSYLARGKHVNQKLQRAWIKYGGDAFELTAIEYVNDPARLLEREQHWIDSTRAVDKGYNIRRVAQSNFGLKASEATKAKMSASRKGRTMSAEARANMSAAQRLYGPRHSEATRAKMSIDRKGRTHTDEAKAKIAIASTGRKLSPESIAKRTAATMATVAARGPLVISDESRARISASKKGRPSKGRKPVLLFGIMYESITAASLAIGRNPQWVKARMGTDQMPEGDIHAKPPVSVETRMRQSASIKAKLNQPGIQAKRLATREANKARTA
jgi:group I intron endonuclease